MRFGGVGQMHRARRRRQALDACRRRERGGGRLRGREVESGPVGLPVGAHGRETELGSGSTLKSRDTLKWC